MKPKSAGNCAVGWATCMVRTSWASAKVWPLLQLLWGPSGVIHSCCLSFPPPWPVVTEVFLVSAETRSCGGRRHRLTKGLLMAVSC